jgi:hypothetical protein
MEAFIARNLTDGKILIKGPTPSSPPIELNYGESYLFKSPEEYQAYKRQVDMMVGARFVEVETVSGRHNFHKEIEKRIEEPKYYEDDSATYFEKNREVIEVRNVPVTNQASAVVVSHEEIRAKAKVLKSEYKKAGASRKSAIKVELEQMKQQIGV